MKINGLNGTFKTSFNIMNEQLGLDKFDIDLTFENSNEMTVGIKDNTSAVQRCII